MISIKIIANTIIKDNNIADREVLSVMRNSDCKNIEKVVAQELCTGCATCVSLCPNSAIRLIKDDSKGIYLPQLKEGECNQCGTCLDVCPGYSVNFKDLNLDIFGQEPKDILLGNYFNCYIGHATDSDIRYNSASGGLVTALLIFALEEGIIDGALVTRMKKDKPLEPEPFIARTKEEIMDASKSKYCPVPANIALKEILESKEGEKYAVVGLPCHLHGIRKAEMVNRKLKDRIALHIGIFCGTTKTFIGTEFQLLRMGIKKEEVAKIDYRGEGWPGSMTVQLKNKQRKLSELYYYYYDSKFSSFVDWRCMVCTDQTAEVADISFGDAWLPEIEKDDEVGTSIIVSRSRHGEEILQQMMHKRKVVLRPISAEKVIESQGGLSGKKRDVKALFALSKLLCKNVPIYNQELLEPKFNSYFSAIQLYSRVFLANRRLWKLLDLYLALMKYGSYLKSKLKL